MTEHRDRCRPRDSTYNTLEAEARDRWGERWTIQQLHYVDGTTRAHAFRFHGKTEDDLCEEERLFLGTDGNFYVRHVLVAPESIAEVLHEDNASEETLGEIVHEGDLEE